MSLRTAETIWRMRDTVGMWSCADVPGVCCSVYSVPVVFGHASSSSSSTRMREDSKWDDDMETDVIGTRHLGKRAGEYQTMRLLVDLGSSDMVSPRALRCLVLDQAINATSSLVVDCCINMYNVRLSRIWSKQVQRWPVDRLGSIY